MAFFARTYLTKGMRLLLTQVAQRLAGKGGEPVIQLQTAFGGGKTHTMLAVYHLVHRTCDLADLVGIPQLIERAGLLDVPAARVAVIDGTAHAPGQPWKHGKQTIKTLWVSWPGSWPAVKVLRASRTRILPELPQATELENIEPRFGQVGLKNVDWEI